MLSTDKSVFDEHSSFRSRIADYAKLFDELYVVVATSGGYAEVNFSEQVRIIPTNSQVKISTFTNFYKIAADIFKRDKTNFVITSQEEFGGFVCALLKWRYGVPWQAQIHSDIFSPYFKKFSYKNAIRSFIAARTLSYATRIRVVSKRIKKSIERRGIQTSVDILPIFVDVRQMQEIAENRIFTESGFDFVFLIVSRLAPEKNIAFAIAVFAEVVKRYPQTTLRIVGDGPMRSSLETLAASLKLGPHVQFEGWQKNIIGYLKAADCFLGTSWYEGYGLSLVEAMAARLPIITTDVGIAGDLIVNNESGIVVSQGDAAAFFDAMIQIRSNSSQDFREKLGSGAYERVNQISSYKDYLAEYYNTLAQCL